MSIQVIKRSLSSNQAMQRTGYRSRSAFWNAVWTQAIPCIRINKRKIIFPEDSLNRWLESRTIGGAA